VGEENLIKNRQWVNPEWVLRMITIPKWKCWSNNWQFSFVHKIFLWQRRLSAP